MTAGTPWWQIAKTVRRGYLLGGWTGIFGLLMLWAGLTVAPWSLLVTAASSLVLAVWYLVSALALRRQERSAKPERQPGLPPSS